MGLIVLKGGGMSSSCYLTFTGLANKFSRATLTDYTFLSQVLIGDVAVTWKLHGEIRQVYMCVNRWNYWWAVQDSNL
jgi:hypothetical protein